MKKYSSAILFASLFVATLMPEISFAAENQTLKKPRSLWVSEPESNKDVAEEEKPKVSKTKKKIKSHQNPGRTCPHRKDRTKPKR